MEVTIATGRRKTSVARVFLKSGEGKITVNGKDYTQYFPTTLLQYKVVQPFSIVSDAVKYDVRANIKGGGITGQAEALRLAISKALVELNPEDKKALKDAGLLTRDPRMVERKKFGRRKARRRFQFSKR